MPRAFWTYLVLLSAASYATPSDGPIRVVFDEGHHNVHTVSGGYQMLADLLAASGYIVLTSCGGFTSDDLLIADIVVVPSPRGASRQESLTDRGRGAFLPEEVESVERWVAEGGSLLLVTDHAPIGSAAALLAAAFGVEGSNGFTEDDGLTERELLFSRENGGLSDHWILTGIGSGPQVERVATFLGQSLAGPEQSWPLLRLGSTAYDRFRRLRTAYIWEDAGPADRLEPANGRSQGLALEHGRGRVVVLGEAGMLTSRGLDEGAVGADGLPIHNRQFALNVLRWLAGEIGPP
jgi:hypothetical protein